MGLILDSSVVIAAERRGDTVSAMLKQIVAATGDQRAVLSAVGLTGTRARHLPRPNSGGTQSA
jgi:hypothetical protein